VNDTDVRTSNWTRKLALIAAAYVAAFALAYIAVALNDASMDPITRQGGMAAFGDTALFLGVFGVCAAAVTAYALYTFRDRAALWRVLSISAMVIAGTAIVALVIFAIVSGIEPGPTAELWGGLAVIRMLVSPLFSVAFAFIGLFAPGRSAKLKFFGAAVVEGATFAYAMTELASGL
jgi:hypothetical protein